MTTTLRDKTVEKLCDLYKDVEYLSNHNISEVRQITSSYIELARRLAEAEQQNQKLLNRLAPRVDYVEDMPTGYGEDEIDRLQQQLAERDQALGELDALLCNIFIRRTKVESILRNNRKIGKSLSPEECLELANQLSIPTFPDSTKANAKILMAARAQEEALTSVNAAIYVDPWSVESEKAKDIYSVACFDLCQAVRAEKEIKDV